MSNSKLRVAAIQMVSRTTVAPNLAEAAELIASAARDGAWRLKGGLSVCYALRFPELYRAMDARDLILVPSAFTATTGRAHWETLLRARAVENLCYVLAPAQGGRHENGRRTYGHSMLIDPCGLGIAQPEEGPCALMRKADPSRLRQPS